MTVTADNAGSVVENVSVLLVNFSVSEQREDNFMLITDIYDNIGLLIRDNEFNATSNVSKCNTSNLWNNINFGVMTLTNQKIESINYWYRQHN